MAIKKNNWLLIKQFMVAFLPMAAIIIIGAYALYYSHNVKSQQAIAEQGEISLLKFYSEFVKNIIYFIEADLRVIASDPVIENLVENGSRRDDAITASMLMAFSKYKGLYDQIRVLDEQGMEILRIDLMKKKPFKVPASELQFKGERYYFRDAFKLSKNEVYVSPFDLNIEHGKIEQPLKPMIRFGMPVYDSRNRKRGILVLNYLGQQILDQLEAHHRNMPGRLMVLNHEGYWLKGLSPEDEWGFMFDDQKENSFKARYPKEWNRVNRSDTGQFLTSRGRYTFSTVYPLQQGMISSTGSRLTFKESSRFLSPKEYFWKIISFVPSSVLNADDQRFFHLLSTCGLVLFLLLGYMSWRIAETSNKKIQAEASLRKSHLELECMVDKRTAELEQLNRTLQNKINEHQSAIDEKKEMENQLRQAQKMEAIGTLAGGIAHDFNNILSIIIGYAELTRELAASNPKMASHVDEILKAGNRAKELVRQILAFSRQTEKELKPLQINLIIKETVKLLRASIPTTIDIREQIDPGSGMVLADVTHIHQIIMNLCTNAYHSMIKTGGMLKVMTKPIVIKKDEHDPPLPPGDYVLLEVSDTGMGMNGQTLSRMFDPYFTTKKMGEGTGLGLSVVHGIVQSYNGHIDVKSAPGAGTRFRIYFPRVAVGALGKDKKKAPLYPRGTEHVLLVDDEEPILKVECQMLESLGYRVSFFSNATQALHAFENDPENVDLVITDMTMPRMTGAELSKRLRTLRPDTLIILCTGFSEQIDQEKAAAIGIQEFIMKPIIKKDLAALVRKVLDSKNKDAPLSLSPMAGVASRPLKETSLY